MAKEPRGLKPGETVLQSACAKGQGSDWASSCKYSRLVNLSGMVSEADDFLQHL